MRTSSNFLFLLLFFLVLCLPGHGVLAFGAGNIPSFAYMERRAFRHGDIEDTLADLIKKYNGGGMALIGSLVGKKGSKFGGLDIKRVYFGNWLRDYSQAVDIAGLQKLPLQTIINLCMALGFLAHGYATNEFEVTIERLGVYLPTEHIDNPKGYGEGQDPKKFDPRLRGPVDPRELEIDPRTGMKNYIANENGTWDTSKALARRTIEKCIHHGRQQRVNGEKFDLYESYRLLGTALHTLEDFTAHSNFCELSLYSMGYILVFLHVGDRARIQAPDGKWVAPLVTGTFGSSDFLHSLLGEATDHISQASVSDLNAELDKAMRSRDGSGGSSSSSIITNLISSIPSGGSSDMKQDFAQLERIRADNASGAAKPPDQLTPQEMHSQLWAILSLRDRIVKKIDNTIENIPGLGPLIEKVKDSISVFVFTALEPLLKPLMKTATSGLMAASGEVINNRDQYQVFDSPYADDPTHSFLSKDHFNLILNEPAGHLAKIIVKHSVDLIVKAWDDPSVNVRLVTEEILECLFHPDFHNVNSRIQRDMMTYMYTWINGLGPQKNSILERLTKEAVRSHKNIRLGGEGGVGNAEGGLGQTYGHQMQADIQGYLHNVPGVAQVESLAGGHVGGGHQHSHHGHHGHHGAYGGQGGHGEGSSFTNVFSSSSNDSGPSGMPSLPNIPGLSALGKISGLTREGAGSEFAEPSYRHERPPVPYTSRPDQRSSSYAPPHEDGSYAPSLFPSEQRYNSSYAPSYAPPPTSQDERLGFPSGQGHGFPDAGSYYPGSGSHYTPPGPQGMWDGRQPQMEEENPYGFVPPESFARQPQSGPPGFPNAEHGYAGSRW